MELRLHKGSIKATRQNVHDMLGIPMRNMKIEDLEQRPSWEDQFSHLQKPTSPTIVFQISSTKEADFMFKMNFIILFESTMETLENDGRVPTNLLKCIRENDDISDIDIDRREYILDCLYTNKNNWNDVKTRGNYYYGSLTFLCMNNGDDVLKGNEGASEQKEAGEEVVAEIEKEPEIKLKLEVKLQFRWKMPTDWMSLRLIMKRTLTRKKKEKQVEIEKEIEAGNKNGAENQKNNDENYEKFTNDNFWDNICDEETFDKIVSTAEENKKLAKESNKVIKKSKIRSMTLPTFSLGMGLSPFVTKTVFMETFEETEVTSKVVEEKVVKRLKKPSRFLVSPYINNITAIKGQTQTNEVMLTDSLFSMHGDP
ncbi:hypothetical protein Tco_1344176 [Tanacetum coccineum]